MANGIKYDQIVYKDHFTIPTSPHLNFIKEDAEDTSGFPFPAKVGLVFDEMNEWPSWPSLPSFPRKYSAKIKN